MSSMTVEFVDTNVLVYAHNRRDERRHPVARDLLTRLTEDGTGAFSIQVPQEWVNVATRRDAWHTLAIALTPTPKQAEKGLRKRNPWPTAFTR